jgi:hypothetical protein
LLLGAGNYGISSITRSGSENNYIVWKAAGDGVAVMEGLTLNAASIWIDGLTFQNNQGATDGLRDSSGRDQVVLTNNSFSGFSYSIRLHPNSHDWHITDNTIVGDKTQVFPPGEAPGQFTGEGIELGRSSGHVVAYNRISRTADGISYPKRNVDIFGNDIFEVSDDGVETDYSYANNRVWGNRFHDVSNYVFSFQPQYGGPWYFVRNQATGLGIALKFAGTTDRFVLVNNTFVNEGDVTRSMQNMLHGLSRNNLFISADGSGTAWKTGIWNNDIETVFPPYLPIWQTDVDYDGFDWGDGGTAIHWNRVDYPDLESFAAAIGIETHAIRVDKDLIFIEFDNTGDAYLVLRPDGNAVDAGAVLANLLDVYHGPAPDLGALESGALLPHYGPRDAEQRLEHARYWSNPYVDRLPGDANHDGQVSGADLIAVQQNFGRIGSPAGPLVGDADQDGQVTGADLIAVQQNFGQALVPAAVPEPASIVMLCSAGGIFFVPRPCDLNRIIHEPFATQP